MENGFRGKYEGTEVWKRGKLWNMKAASGMKHEAEILKIAGMLRTNL